MTTETLEEALKRVLANAESRIELRRKKTHDYASEGDWLGNFRRVSTILGTLNVKPDTMWGVAVIYIVLKLDRLCNLIFNAKTPENESISDTLDDLRNYVDLLEDCLIEKGIIEKC